MERGEDFAPAVPSAWNSYTCESMWPSPSIPWVFSERFTLHNPSCHPPPVALPSSLSSALHPLGFYILCLTASPWKMFTPQCWGVLF